MACAHFRLGGSGAELCTGSSWGRIDSAATSSGGHSRGSRTASEGRKGHAGSTHWSPRCDHACLVTSNGTVWLFGGVNRGCWAFGDTWRSRDDGASWEEVPPRPVTYAAMEVPCALVPVTGKWSDRSGHAVLVLGRDGISEMVLLGGVGKGGPLADVWSSCDGGESWAPRLLKSPWCPRYGHTALALPGGGILVCGGATTGRFLADAWCSNDGGSSWSPASEQPVPWQERAAHAAVAVPSSSSGACGVIVLLGGVTEDGFMRDVWRTRDAGATWETATLCAPWEARSGPAVVATAGHMLVLCGGFAGSRYFSDVWATSDMGSTWTSVLRNAPWSPRYCHALAALDSRRILLLGGHAGDQSLADVWESPCRREVRRHALVALMIGRRLESRGISRETWESGVVPFLLPLRLATL